jgi:hypothetical protein
MKTYGDKAKHFVPSVIEEGYGIVCVAIGQCSNCERPTIATGSGAAFPAFWQAGRAEQLKRADWKEASWSKTAKGLPLCKECAPKAAAFTCALCKQARTGEPEESFGDPAEYLCAPCYETVPAKVWDAKSKELSDKHQYDFE